MKLMPPEEAVHYREYVKAKRICARYDVSEQWIYDQIALDKFPAPKRFGKLSRWSMNELLAWEIRNGWKPEESVTVQEAC